MPFAGGMGFPCAALAGIVVSGPRAAASQAACIASLCCTGSRVAAVRLCGIRIRAEATSSSSGVAARGIGCSGGEKASSIAR